MKASIVKMGMATDQYIYQWPSEMLTRPSPKALIEIYTKYVKL